MAKVSLDKVDAKVQHQLLEIILVDVELLELAENWVVASVLELVKAANRGLGPSDGGWCRRKLGHLLRCGLHESQQSEQQTQAMADP